MKKIAFIILFAILISSNIFSTDLSNTFKSFVDKNVEILYSVGGGGKYTEKGVIKEVFENGVILQSKNGLSFINFEYIIIITTKDQ